MAITYTWEITNLRKAPQLDGMQNVLVHVRWKKIGTDENGTTGEFQGATPLSAPVVVGTYEQHVNEQIQKQITKKNDPWADVDTAPWGQNLAGPSPNPGPAAGE